MTAPCYHCYRSLWSSVTDLNLQTSESTLNATSRYYDMFQVDTSHRMGGLEMTMDVDMLGTRVVLMIFRDGRLIVGSGR
jgi:hypothetical protein